MEEDADLTHLLAQAAERPDATPDSFREVLVRHRRGRTRALVAALAAVALVGPAAGIAVGRATADHATQVATGGPPPATGANSSGGSSGTADSGGVASQSAGVPSPLPGSQVPAPKRLFVRTTADGVTIRAYLQEHLPGEVEAHCASDQGETPCPTPPPECSPPSSQIQTELSDDGAVDPGFVPVTTTDHAGPLVVLNASYFGVMEGDPAAWAAVKADAGVAQVRVRFADGATDEMVPVDGYAVFAHRTAAPTPTQPQTKPPSSPEEADAMMKASIPQGSAEALDVTGAVLSTIDLPSAAGAFSAHCDIATKPAMPVLPGGKVAPPPPPVTATTRP